VAVKHLTVEDAWLADMRRFDSDDAWRQNLNIASDLRYAASEFITSCTGKGVPRRIHSEPQVKANSMQAAIEIESQS